MAGAVQILVRQPHKSPIIGLLCCPEVPFLKSYGEYPELCVNSKMAYNN